MSESLKSLQSIASNMKDFRSFSPLGYNNSKPSPSNLSGYITRVQFARLAADVKDWRDAIGEMEFPFYPMRGKFVRIGIDVIENPIIKAMLQRWRELTLQRDRFIYQIQGGKRVKSEVLTQTLNAQPWFDYYLEYVLDAILWGYSLIELGDIDENNGTFPEISFTRRENIRPDGVANSGAILTSMPYMLDGVRVEKGSSHPAIPLFNHWVPTKSNRGVSKCGYGLLYNMSLLEIHLRHIMEWQMDYLEMYGQPIRKGTTRKQGAPRKKFEQFLAGAAANSYVLLDPSTGDDVEYVMPAAAGTAWKAYLSVKKEYEGNLSQLILGHTDAMVSLPGKLGGQQAANKDGFNESLIEQAMNAKQISCGNFLSRNVDEISAPLFRKLGKYVGSKRIENLLPEGCYFGLENDKEEQEVRRRVNSHRELASKYFLNMFNAGLRPADISEVNDIMLTKGGWKFELPERKLDEKRESDTKVTTDSLDKPDAENENPENKLVKKETKE